MQVNDHVEVIREFCRKAGQNAPDVITVPSEPERILRAKLAIEEALELCAALGVSVSISSTDITEANLSFEIDTKRSFDMIEVADAAADIFWVSCGGVAALCGFNFAKVLEEVDRSNMSKFVDGYRRDDGKWVKGKSWTPPDIKSVLQDIV